MNRQRLLNLDKNKTPVNLRGKSSGKGDNGNAFSRRSQPRIQSLNRIYWLY
jgi:hypothetical protein